MSNKQKSLKTKYVENEILRLKDRGSVLLFHFQFVFTGSKNCGIRSKSNLLWMYSWRVQSIEQL